MKRAIFPPSLITVSAYIYVPSIFNIPMHLTKAPLLRVYKDTDRGGSMCIVHCRSKFLYLRYWLFYATSLEWVFYRKGGEFQQALLHETTLCKHIKISSQGEYWRVLQEVWVVLSAFTLLKSFKI
jgi:hypothetical protein